MARQSASAVQKPTPRSSQKRSVHELAANPYDVPDDVPTPTPKRTRGNPEEVAARRTAASKLKEKDIDDSPDEIQPSEEPTPSKRRPGRPPKAQVVTPSAVRQKSVVATPIRLNGINGADTPSRRNNADRSARRKSARALIDRIVNGANSDDDGDDDEEIARRIYESSEEDEDEEQEEDSQQPDSIAATPSKRGPGRPRKTTTTTTTPRKRSPPPPTDLPPHEQYFYQNKPGLSQTSANNLSSLTLLTHEEYFSLHRATTNPHATSINSLHALHAASFPQWAFELSQGFTPCIYGYGSKRLLLHQFATYLTTHSSPNTTTILINGYLPSLTLRDLLTTLASALSLKIPLAPPQTMTTSLLTHLSTLPPSTTLHLLINSLDATALRKPPAQSVLAQLASHPQIHLACTVDTPDFSLLWDSGQRSSFNFAFHDGTTFSPLSAQLDVVDEVHELLGRLARRRGGREGVTFVLQSLPENAKSLFRLLVSEVLVAMEGDGEEEGTAVEYRLVYNKAVQEFICSSEMAFRTLLKEFHDHQIITSHKDALGTELLSLPFRKEELEGILEDLMS